MAASGVDRIASTDLDGQFGPVVAPSKPVRYAWITQHLPDPFWDEVLKGLKKESDKLGVTLDASAPSDRLDESGQLALARTALAANPDVLLVTPISATNLKPVIEEANAKGIPTISINLRPEGVRVHIGTDHVSLGASAAEYLHELYPAGAAVAEVEGALTSPYRIDRVKGFGEGLAVYPNLHLVAGGQADWDDGKAGKLTLAMIKEHPEIKGIYANSDLMAVGATKALASIGRGDVAVVGTDGVPIAKQSIQSGGMKGTTAQFPPQEGALAIQTGLRLLACKPIPAWVVSPQAVMTEKSVGDYATVN